MTEDTLAAIDLGSNSFHMIIARITDGQLQVVDKLREMVQLADGLDENNRLSRESQERALACLARFGQRLRDIPPSQVRIVGTNTLRKARNSAPFLKKAEEVLWHSIDIVSGIEEARLIYLGVAHTSANLDGKRMVIDIGGGSTELITGEQFNTLNLESLFMGCVSMTRRFFDDGRIDEKRLRKAELATRVEVEPVEQRYRELGWDHVIGASGSIKAIRDVVVREGWTAEGITLDAMRRLRDTLQDMGNRDKLAERWNLEPARARVFVGGFVVLHGVCEALGIEQMQVSDGALREGAIYDLLGRIRHEDVRDRAILALGNRAGLDTTHAERVVVTALALLDQVRQAWKLEDEQQSHLLEWAARMHEIGLALAHNQYHKHGGYIVQYSDLAGFSRNEQQFMATLVRGHRRKFPQAAFKALPKPVAKTARRLCVLLRLAVLFHRSRSPQPLPKLELVIEDKKKLKLHLPLGWLDDHPLTRADLAEEAQFLAAAGFTLDYGA